MKASIVFNGLNAVQKKKAEELYACNSYLQKYQMHLSSEDIKVLIRDQKESLIRSGRIEFRGGLQRKLILEFGDSPYIYQDNLLETLGELQEAFYYFKNESEDELPDDELLAYMIEYFNGICQGSVDYMISTMLEWIDLKK